MSAQHVSRTREVHRLKQWCYPFGRNAFWRKLLIDLPKIDFLKFFIIYSITGLSYSENSNGYNSVHIWPILMNDFDDLPLDCLCEGLSNDVIFVPGHGSWPGSGLNYPVVARSEIFLPPSDRACGKTWKTRFISLIYLIWAPNNVSAKFSGHSPLPGP